jgi:hypothetical protein
LALCLFLTSSHPSPFPHPSTLTPPFDASFLLLPVVQDEASTFQADIMAGKCPMDGAPDATLLRFSKPPALKVIQGKAGNATFHVDVDNGGWVRAFVGLPLWFWGRRFVCSM